MWHKQFREAWTHGKKTVGHMWNTAVKYAGQLDHAVGVGKRIFSALQPAIQDAGGGGLNRAVMQGISGYEQGRHQIMGGHNNVQATLSRLRRAAPELEL